MGWLFTKGKYTGFYTGVLQWIRKRMCRRAANNQWSVGARQASSVRSRDTTGYSVCMYVCIYTAESCVREVDNLTGAGHFFLFLSLYAFPPEVE